MTRTRAPALSSGGTELADVALDNMKLIPRTLLVVALLLAGSVPQAQQEVVPAPVRAAADTITADSLKRDLDFLAADALLGRNTPSPGFDTAAEYIIKRLETAGLKPLGDKGTYRQHYEMHESRVDTAGAYLEIAGRRFAFGEDFVLRSFARPVAGALAVVYVGHGWTVAEKGIDPFAGMDVKGKIVLAHAQRAMPKGAEIRQIGRINVGGIPVVEEAQRRGAAGVVFLSPGSGAQTFQQMREQNTTRRELEPSVPSAYAAAPITSVLVSRAAADALLAGERTTAADLIARGDASDYPAPFELSKRVTLNIPVAETTVLRPYNVVAMIEGSDPVLKNEYVTIASHLDGAVGSRTVDGDAIYNSADDNASGSAGNLHIAERMAALKPKRSLIFIWDSGEERGLWGTRHFVGNPPVPMQNIVAHINIDMIGANRAPGSADADSPDVAGPNEVYLVGPGVLSAQMDTLLDRVNDSYLKMRFNRDQDRPDLQFFYPRTDAGPFLERGVVTINFFTGIHPRYHLPADEAAKLDPGKMETITRTIFASIWAIADLNERPRIDKPLPPSVPRYK